MKLPRVQSPPVRQAVGDLPSSALESDVADDDSTPTGELTLEDLVGGGEVTAPDPTPEQVAGLPSELHTVDLEIEELDAQGEAQGPPEAVDDPQEAIDSILSLIEGPGSVTLAATLTPKDRFDDEGEIARGGMAAIHLVFDRNLRRHAARKRMHDATRRDPESCTRFVEESQIAGQLDHPNIVPVYDFALDDQGGPESLTMKLVQGHTLGQILSRLGPHRLEERNLTHLIRVLLKVCEAVSFAHSRHVIHRDLKPANIMLGSHGQVYVMDWGLGLVRDRKEVIRREKGKIAGTPWFMAPEQAWAKIEDVDSRADVYALCGIVYFVLTGRPPHEGKTAVEATRAAQSGVVVPPQDRVSGQTLPPELCRIAMKGLEADPTKRYQTVDQLSRDLEQVLRGGGWFATRFMPAGTMIIQQGEAADAAYVIVSGQCDAVKTVGKEQVLLRRMGPGEVFGETAVLTAHPRTASVVAATNVTLKVITREALDQELARNTWMKALVSALAQRFREADERVTRLQSRKT